MKGFFLTMVSEWLGYFTKTDMFYKMSSISLCYVSIGQ